MFACRELFCAICGGPFTALDVVDPSCLSDDDLCEMEYSYNARVLSFEDAKWLRHFQMFGVVRPDHAPGIDGFQKAFVSSSVEWRYGFDFEPHIQYTTAKGSQRSIKLPAYTFLTAEWDEMLFPIHDACLTLARKYLAPARASTPQKALTNLSIALGERLKECERQVDRNANRLGFGESGGLEWEHGYFGARAFWADPWNCEYGAEWLCTDPLCFADVLVFVNNCLTWPCALRSHSSEHHDPLQERAAQPNFGLFTLAPEVLDLIAELLPLRSVLNLHSTCRSIAARLSPMDDTFWRSRTLALYGPCLWELNNLIAFRTTGNWKGLLRILTLTRKAITAFKPDVNADLDAVQHARSIQEQAYAPDILSEASESPGVTVPTVLLNRLRIWAILDSMELDGKSL